MTTPNPTGSQNIYLLAADASPHLLPTLHASPTLINSQDATGYSLIHALASYNHLDLLRRLHTEFPTLNPNLADEDGETALFVVETVAAAHCLVDELGVDWRHRNGAGETAEEKIRAEGEFVVVADYLGEVRRKGAGGGGGVGDADDAGGAGGEAGGGASSTLGESGGLGDAGVTEHPPRLPPGMSLEMGQLLTAEQAVDELGAEPDPEFRRRIEELAARDDFRSEDGQRLLRELVQDAVRGVGGGAGQDEGREAQRQRTE